MVSWEPRKILKDLWFTPSQYSRLNVFTYISKPKDKINEVQTFVKSNLLKTQAKMEQSHARGVMRTFNPRDKVLLFLPTPGNSLKSKFSGFCIVANRITPLNYIVYIPDRHKGSHLQQSM